MVLGLRADPEPLRRRRVAEGPAQHRRRVEHPQHREQQPRQQVAGLAPGERHDQREQVVGHGQGRRDSERRHRDQARHGRHHDRHRRQQQCERRERQLDRLGGQTGVAAQVVTAQALPEPVGPQEELAAVLAQPRRTRGRGAGGRAERHRAELLPVDPQRGVEVVDGQPGGVDVDLPQRAGPVDPADAGQHAGHVHRRPAAPEPPEPFDQGVVAGPVGGQQPGGEPARRGAKVGVQPSVDRHHGLVGEQRQHGVEVVGVQDGVGVEQDHELEPVDQPERLDARVERPGPAEPAHRLGHLRAGRAGDLGGAVGGVVGDEVDVGGRHQPRGGLQRGADQVLLVVRGDEDGDVPGVGAERGVGCCGRASRPAHEGRGAGQGERHAEHEQREQQHSDHGRRSRSRSSTSGGRRRSTGQLCRRCVRMYSCRCTRKAHGSDRMVYSG